VVTGAQEPDHGHKLKTLIEKGDSLRIAYRFDESLDAYEAALELTENELYAQEDSLLRLDIKDKMLMSENGRSMMDFVDIPDVVAKRKFSIDDFFLYYPLQDSSWRNIPNQLDSSANHNLARAAYIRSQDRTIYWSAPDKEGIRNIYTSSLTDTLWSLPSLLNEQITSASDEIYPVLSPDGKSLFFSSAGLYGVGGYDIYVSRWDDDSNDWEAPVNLGFPYSSPADDFLYIDTEDARHTVFASNRECSGDSVWVYVLEYNNVPVRRSVRDSEELMQISKLYPVASDSGHSHSARTHNSEIQKYVDMMRGVLSLKDSVSHYSALAAEGKPAERLWIFRDSLKTAQSDLQQTEMKLLMKGIVIDIDDLMGDGGEQPEVANEEYIFKRMHPGADLNMQFEIPEVKFDYSFKVLDVAQFAEDQSIPSGVVYQIQIFASKQKASLKSLKGLSPVYETRNASGHIVYRVGLFRTYTDVLGHLNTVKKLGFRNAYITAYIDGKIVGVAKARAKEKEKPSIQEFYEVRMMPDGGTLDTSVAAGIRQQAAGKDIAKAAAGDGTVAYVVGPFANKSQADDLVQFIKAMGVAEVECRVIKK
jgi:hypothetical protein